MTTTTETTRESAWPGREVKDARIRLLCQRLVRRGYRYQWFKSHGMLFSPDGETKHAVHWTIPVGKDFTLWVADLKRLGWGRDMAAETVRGRRSTTHVQTFEDIEVPWTDSEWRELQRDAGGWRALLVGEREEVADETAPPAEPKVLSEYAQGLLDRLERGVVPRHAQGKDGWTLAAARDLLRQGYSLGHVIRRTGWGSMWLEDLAERLNREAV